MQEKWEKLIKKIIDIYNEQNYIFSKKTAEHLHYINNELGKLKENFKLNITKSKQKPVCSYLPAIYAENKYNQKNVIKLIAELDSKFYWQYGYDNVSKKMEKNYAYTEIIGPKGPVISTKIIIGLVLLAPDYIYPEHSHDKIEESYISLSGKTAYNNKMLLTKGSFVFNPAGYLHELKTGPDKPVLLLYAWRANDEILENYEMNLD